MTTGEIVAIIGVTVTGLVQFGALVWFAATMRAELRETRREVSEIKDDVQRFQTDHNKLDGRVIVLEADKITV